jgi:ABC-type sugar transport system permease subunit
MKRLTIEKRNALTGLAFVAPWIAGFLVFTLYPLAETAFLSLNKVKIAGDGIRTKWAGINNYRDIFVMDVAFIDALMNYLKEVIVYVPLITVFALVIAMLLNTKIRGAGVFRTVFFLPVIISSGPVMEYLSTNGALNLPGNTAIIEALTGSGALPASLASILVFLINSFTAILWSAGLQILIFLAALQKTDTSMVEAALIDGASQWVIFWRLTLVQLNPMIVINVLFTIVMRSVFSLNPIISKIRTDLYLPDRGFGYAAALSWIYFILILVIICLGVVLCRRREKPSRSGR